MNIAMHYRETGDDSENQAAMNPKRFPQDVTSQDQTGQRNGELRKANMKPEIAEARAER